MPLVALVLALLAPVQAPDATPIEAIRKYALNYSAGLPNFFCTETIRRFRNTTTSPEWMPTDALTVQLSYFEHREDYKLLLVDGQKTKLRYDEAGGSISQGEFGSMLQDVFQSAAETVFSWDSRSALRGRSVQVYRYAILPENARYQLSFNLNDRRYSARAGRHGLVYVAANGEILRITSEADHLPDTFPIEKLSSTLDYDFTEIAGRQFLVPHTAVVDMQAGILGSRNEIDFRDYRKFNAEAGITFDK